MGYRTIIDIGNDALHAFQKDPKGFGEAILKGIEQANYDGHQASVSFKGYCNSINVEPSRHADHHAMFLNMGNCLTVVGAYENDFQRILKHSPDFAKKLVKTAKEILKGASEAIKKMETTKEKTT